MKTPVKTNVITKLLKAVRRKSKRPRKPVYPPKNASTARVKGQLPVLQLPKPTINYADQIAIYESEMRVMAGLANEKGDLETGGAIYGLLTRANRFVICLVTGPGDRAVHRTAYFQMDAQWLGTVDDELTDRFSIQYCGNWHSHHFLGLDTLSTGDIGQVRSMAVANDFTHWCGILVNRHDLGSCRVRWPGPSKIEESSRTPVNTQAKAFYFAEAQNGRFIEVPIRVLPGMSPYRQALLASGKLNPSDIGEQAIGFPLNQIRFSSAREAAVAAQQPMESLNEHLRLLPVEAQRQVRLRAAGELVVVTLPLSGNQTALVAMGGKPPHEILAVHLRSNADSPGVDVTSRLRGSGKVLRLVDVYAALASTERPKEVTNWARNSWLPTQLLRRQDGPQHDSGPEHADSARLDHESQASNGNMTIDGHEKEE